MILYTICYADDFVILSRDKLYLEYILSAAHAFLEERLRLTMHPDKISISTVASGVDFLGWVHFPDHRVLRTTTKKRMFKGIKLKKWKQETVQSYLGLLMSGNSWKLRQVIRNQLSGISG